jgi:hypothetical protein
MSTCLGDEGPQVRVLSPRALVNSDRNDPREFTDKAKIDNGNIWPTYFALAKLTPEDETKIASSVKKAVG